MTPESPTERLQEIGIAIAMRESLWLYPAVEILHILGFVVLVGAVVMFDLRVLGLSSRIPVRMLAQHLLPWSLASLMLVVPAGLLLFLSDAATIIANPAFRLKILLLFVVACNAIAFHLGPYRTVVTWDVHTPAPRAARFHAAISLLLWVSIIACGRSIAYV
ncbi:MAG: DUF6644 family protein [Burkholderiales bacterium]